MKKLYAISLALAVVALGYAVQQTHADIAGSSHDLHTVIDTPDDQTCVVCHTPHNARAGITPLWNHEVTSATFTPYSSSTLDNTMGQPSGVSLLCLSCHDGTVALDAYGAATTGTVSISGAALLDTDLSNDHPISIAYDTSVDDGLNDPAGLDSRITLFGTAPGTVECASCHDVHDQGESAAGHLLVMSNSGSTLCLECHNK